MRYLLILPIVFSLGCHRYAPAMYTHAGPDCLSLDPDYYRSLSDADLAVCSHSATLAPEPVPGQSGVMIGPKDGPYFIKPGKNGSTVIIGPNDGPYFIVPQR